jgi:hypothetical protein
MKKPIEVVMLPTEDKSILHLWTDEKGSRPELCEIEYSHTRNTQHVYTTVSQDVEPIKEGDNCIDIRNNTIFMCTSPLNNPENFRKIIGTDDPKLTISCSNIIKECDESGWDGRKQCMNCKGTARLPIPQVQQSFLKEFVANPDGEWEVEYEEIIRCYKCNKLEEDCINTSANCLGYFEGIDKLKLNQDNTVNITSINNTLKQELIKHLESNHIEASENRVKVIMKFIGSITHGYHKQL